MDLMQKARARMLVKHVFFGTILVSTKCIPDETIPTACTNMIDIRYNPKFINDIGDVDKVLFVLAHEVGHVMLMHGHRLQGRDPFLFNIAGDYAINWMLKECGFNLLDGCLVDEKYKDMSAEQIYDDLLKDAKKRKKGKGKGGGGSATGNGQPSDGGDGDYPDPLGRDLKPGPGANDPEERARQVRAIQQKVAQAANMARMAGQMPGALERLVNEVLDPAVPWNVLLRDYMTRITYDDETWSRRNRRFETFLPSRHSLAMGEIVMICDTSGSIGVEELNKVAAEISSIADTMRPERIRVIWCDAHIAGEQCFELGEEIKLVPKGGGGTDMRVGLDRAEVYNPIVTVLCTDGYTPWPDVEPPYPLIVCCSTMTKCPVGQVVRI